MNIPIGVTEKNALFSVSDKTDLAEHARILSELGYTIYASGGTARVIREANVPVTDVAELVGGGAMLGHRVVTLSRELHAALLADALKPEDLNELVEKHIPFIDIVRVDFYPLQKTIGEVVLYAPNREEAIRQVVEGTDIGGPTMVRSGAKGLRVVICRAQDMEIVLEELKETKAVSTATRQHLRARAEYEVAKYVGMSAEFHGNGRFKVIAGERVGETFKGENGSQSPAGLFTVGSDDPLGLDKFKLVEGSSPSYNNWCDVDRLLQTMTRIARTFEANCIDVPFIAVACKHGNPCGAAVGDSPYPALRQMVFGDRRAIFGGLVMTNFGIDGERAEVMADAMPQGKALFDGVIAPSFSNGAIDKLARHKGKCRLMTNPALRDRRVVSIDEQLRFRYVRGGLLVQPNYNFILNFKHPEHKVFGRPLSDAAKRDLLLASAICSTSNSNTITIVRDGMLIGNGVGQQDRVGAAKLARLKANEAGHAKASWWRDVFSKIGLVQRRELEGAVACSDSFFPFPDAVEVLIDAGIKVIFSTSGSRNDDAVRKVCEKNGVTLVQIPDSIGRMFFGH